MANSVIGALRVNLGLDSAKFQTGIKKSKGTLQKFASFAKGALVAAAAAITTAFAGIAAGVRSTIKDMDNLAKTSRQIGVTVEELSQLRFAAELAGITFEQLSNGLGKFAKSMSDAVRTSTSEQALAFKALGINVRDSNGALRGSLDVMKEVAERFSRIEDGAGKTAIAMSIFGRAGRTMIPLLNEGAAGINKMMEEADRLGLTIDTKTAKAAEKFNDTLTRINSVFKGIINRITSAMLPALQSVATWMFNASKNTKIFEMIGKALGFTLRTITTGVVALVAQFKVLLLWIGAVGKSLASLISGDLDTAYGHLKTAVSGTADIVKESVESIKGIWTDHAEEVAAAAPDISNKIAAPVIQAEKKIKVSNKKIKVQLTEAEKFMRDLSDTFEGFGTDLFSSAIEGSFNLKNSLRSLLNDLGRLISNQFMRMLLSGSLGGGTSGGFLSGLFGALPGFATGGSFNVGGAGGIDSQLVAFRASPNENVSITKPGQSSSGGSDVDVIIVNESNGAATVQRGESGTGSNGRQFQKLYVRDAIHEAMPSGLRKQKGFAISPVITKR
jgi:uncharacterized protein YukE